MMFGFLHRFFMVVFHGHDDMHDLCDYEGYRMCSGHIESRVGGNGFVWVQDFPETKAGG